MFDFSEENLSLVLQEQPMKSCLNCYTVSVYHYAQGVSRKVKGKLLKNVVEMLGKNPLIKSARPRLDSIRITVRDLPTFIETTKFKNIFLK